MSTPPGPESVPPWPNMGSGDPSPAFLAAFLTEMARRAAETATGAADPLTPMDAMCVTAHTLFESAVRGGFTDRQAIIFTAEILMRQQ